LHALFNIMFVIQMQAVAPIFSLVAPTYRFKGSHKWGIPISRDPTALVAKYSNPPVLHGTADRVTDPLASQDLFNDAQEVRCWKSCKCV
ncbi:hypothetical protein A4A49_60702, partial [Nicotiana attenuata]